MGYDVSDYRAVHPPYGTVEDIEQLIAGLHARNMRLLLDLVVNHTSDQVRIFYCVNSPSLSADSYSMSGSNNQDLLSTALIETGTSGESPGTMLLATGSHLTTGQVHLEVCSVLAT